MVNREHLDNCLPQNIREQWEGLCLREGTRSELVWTLFLFEDRWANHSKSYLRTRTGSEECEEHLS